MKISLAERRQRDHFVHADPGADEIDAHHDGAEYALGRAARDAEDIGQIAVHLEDQAVMVPRDAGPEPHPAGAADNGADDDHADPQHDEAEDEREDRKFSLFVCVIAVAQGIGVDIGNHHQPDNDQAGEDHARHPGIEVDQHLLQAQEVPGRLGRIHGQRGIGRLFERRVQGDRPDHQDDCDDDGGQELDAQQIGPDVHFLGPTGLPGLGLAVVRLGQRRIGLKLADQPVVGERLAQTVPGVERHDEKQQHDGDVVRRAEYGPKLVKIHVNPVAGG